MDANAKVNFPSIFDTAVESEKDFDSVFGAEEDSDLMDAVCGFKEDGTVLPDDSELHQTDDDALPKDIKDELGEGHDTDNAPKEPKADPTVKVDPENIDGESDKATDTFDKAYDELMKEAAEDMGEGDPAIEDDELGSEDEACKSKKTVDEGCGSKKTVKEEEDLVSDLDDDGEDESKDTEDKDNEEEEDLVSGLGNDEDGECKDSDKCDSTDEACGSKKTVKEEEDLVSDLDDDGEDESDDEMESEDEACKSKKTVDEGCGSKKTVKEEVNLLDPTEDEEDLIDAVDGESAEESLSPEEIDALNTDSDEDLIDIVAGE